MDLLSFIGVDAIPKTRVVSHPVNLLVVTQRNVYEEIASLAIGLPGLPIMPAYLTGWSGVRHLFDLHVQASKWTPMKDEVRKKAEWVWKNTIQKNPAPYLEAVEALHELREDGSGLSPLMWCWWRIMNQIEEGYTGLGFSGIWHAKMLRNRKLRRFYYEEIDQDNLCRRKVWPEPAEKMLDLLKEFEAKAEKIASTSEQSALWTNTYLPFYAEFYTTALFIRDSAQRRIRDRAEKFDLGVWLSANLISYLGLSQVKSNLVSTPLTPKPVLRKKNSRS